MTAVKVVLISADGSRELELGPFNQGVHFEQFDPTAPLTCYDTAGAVTKNAVVRFLPHLGWVAEGGHSAAGELVDQTYWHLHVQTVA